MTNTNTDQMSPEETRYWLDHMRLRQIGMKEFLDNSADYFGPPHGPEEILALTHRKRQEIVEFIAELKVNPGPGEIELLPYFEHELTLWDALIAKCPEH